MREYVLNYYPKFNCIAGECKHTCCAGWEICIDKQSLLSYKHDRSSFSKRLKKGINFRKTKFKVDKNGRCAFLNDKGLCEIIMNLGEQSLCQVCRDHPKFRSFFNDHTEMGLGFCCEASAKIILSFEDKIELKLTNSSDGVEEADFNQKNILAFREKALGILQNRNNSINDRIARLLKECRIDCFDKSFNNVLKTFLRFEKIDKNWTKRIKSSKNFLNKTVNEDLALYCEQFLVNELYRHLSDAEDTMWVRARTTACILAWWMINSIIEKEREKNQNLFELTVDVVRDYSAEVEYSQKNLNKLFCECYKLIKI